MSALKPLLAASLCAALSACALLGKSDPVVPRYFSPMDGYAAAVVAAKPQSELRLRLGRVEGMAHLREQMVVRSSPEEITYLDERRWTERPEVYVRQALSTALFEERGVTSVMSGRAITLEVELTAFEEIVQPQYKVRMQAIYTLHDEKTGLLQATVTIEQPVQDAKGDDRLRAVVDAYSLALHTGVEQIATEVVAKLTAIAATPAAP